ncbi:hypothetical protein [Paracoccus aminophilus]|uniref:Uncharacterized protein n=1 Tax=Paracoccus aminophilus JCM 7686 TaxID=1367847 RepID=S5YR00_PARAH|nr:hypothetical protein [Paracoccus aminophilus]AGT07681.1 hypothetical protein JCM7686_0572 [Paracoccus aminophilus JCM 7686]
MKFRPAFAVLSMTLALAACGSEMPWQKKPAAAPEETAPTHSGPPAVSPIDQPIETGAAGVALATSEATTRATKLIRASGQGWTATGGESSVVYERPGQKSVGVTTRRISYARGVEFIGIMSGKPFSLNVQAAECTDAAGAKHPFTARLTASGAKLTGCADATDSQPKAQIKASSATGKPKAAAPKPAAAPAAEAAKPAETPAASPAATTETKPAETTPATSTPATTHTPETTTPATPAPVTTAPATTAPATTTPATPAAPVPEIKSETTPSAPVPAAPVVTAPVVTTPAPVITAPAPVETAPATGATN